MPEVMDELSVFEGMRPTRVGDLALESHGMAPVHADARYGGVHRMFTVWFTPNMELSGVFTGTLAVVLGLGFQLGLAAIVIGTIIGSLPVAILCTWGPKTGTAQVPLARLPFGKAILLVLFVVLSVRIFQHHIVLSHNTLHGGALVGAFVLMVTVSLSAGISWATYASDYSRYMKPTSSRKS